MKKKLIWVTLGLGVVGLGAWAAVRAWKPKPSTWREVAVARGTLQIKILSTGVVLPENRVEIKPPISGRVERVIAEESERVRKGQILAWMSSTERAALLDAARAQGPEELARWGELYRPTPMIAPLDGTIIARNVETGQTVTANDSVYVLSDRLIIKAQVDETDIGRVRRGMPVQFNLDSHAAVDLTGRVIRIAEESKTVSNVTTYQVEILPESVPAFMKSGMTANVHFLGEKREEVLLIPAEAIRYEAGEAIVTLPGGPDAASGVARTVKTGLSDGKSTEIVSGLEENDRVRITRLTPAAAAEEKVNPLGFNRPRGARR